jgi:hypothetical protein
MARAEDVKPKSWLFDKQQVLFDNGIYSLVVGLYQHPGNKPRPAIGERWNGEGDRVGFPRDVHGNPIWHVVPGTAHGNLNFEVSILHAVLEELASYPDEQEPEEGKNAEQTAEVRRGRILKELGQALQRQHDEENNRPSGAV